MTDSMIVRAWKDKRFAASLAAKGIEVPANPAGSVKVCAKDFEMSEMLTSPICTDYHCTTTKIC